MQGDTRKTRQLLLSTYCSSSHGKDNLQITESSGTSTDSSEGAAYSLISDNAVDRNNTPKSRKKLFQKESSTTSHRTCASSFLLICHVLLTVTLVIILAYSLLNSQYLEKRIGTLEKEMKYKQLDILNNITLVSNIKNMVSHEIRKVRNIYYTNKSNRCM